MIPSVMAHCTSSQHCVPGNAVWHGVPKPHGAGHLSGDSSCTFCWKRSLLDEAERPAYQSGCCWRPVVMAHCTSFQHASPCSAVWHGSAPSGTAAGAGPARTVAVTALWSLPPLPMIFEARTPELGTLAKMLSTPPKEFPLKASCKWGHRLWIVRDPAFALKSPTRMRRSPGCPCVTMTFSRLWAVARPPQAPPELTESGPWWFTKKRVLPVVRCCKRIHWTPRLP
mmetsp:Transcript_87400/g.271546  ORF Transcript_87400/g.271546 Transcript_87400/m.271546 type:complete len:226 (-) Transcript_87400:550-1227(-)